MEEYQKTNARGRMWRTVAIIAVAIIFIGLMIMNLTTKQAPSELAWNQATTTGDPDGNNHYIMYTDIMCPYCDVFSRLTMENQEEFDKYLADNNILFEIRLTDYLYEGNGLQASRDSAEGAYCAMRENKFWDYYHGAIKALWDDYHSKGIGSSRNAPPITDMPEDYWVKIGHKAGLGEEFDKCMSNHETVDEIKDNTRRALQVTEGMPYFKFNRFATAGFDNNWGWEYVLRYLDAGLGK